MGTNFADIVDYIVVFISEFADKYGLTQSNAYKYLTQYNVIEQLQKHYEIVHTLRLDDVIEDMAQYCKRHGGTLV